MQCVLAYSDFLNKKPRIWKIPTQIPIISNNNVSNDILEKNEFDNKLFRNIDRGKEGTRTETLKLM